MSGAILVLGVSGRADLTAFADPSTVFGYNPTPNSTVYSETTTARAQGGVAPYTYSWVRTSGLPDTVAFNPSSASTIFYVFTNGTQETVWTCTITDSVGTTVDVVVSCSLTAGNAT